MILILHQVRFKHKEYEDTYTRTRNRSNRLSARAMFASVGMADTDGTPYVLPMNFGYKDGVIYLHSAQGMDEASLYWNVIRKSVLRLVLTMPWFSSIRR